MVQIMISSHNHRAETVCSDVVPLFDAYLSGVMVSVFVASAQYIGLFDSFGPFAVAAVYLVAIENGVNVRASVSTIRASCKRAIDRL